MHPPSAPLVPQAKEEGRHLHDSDELWSESHYLDAVSADGATGVYARIGRLPNQSCSHLVVAVVQRNGPCVMLVDAAAPPATERPGGGERIEDSRYSFELAIDQALEVASVRFSGVAYEYDNPTDALEARNGRAVELSFDLRWETDAVGFRWRISERYEIPCRVTGLVRIDGSAQEFVGPGQRDHSWGARPWWALNWCWTAFHLADGERWHTVSMPIFPDNSVGYRQLRGVVSEISAVAETMPQAPGTFGVTTLKVSPPDDSLTLTPVAFAPIKLVSQAQEVTWFCRAMCDVRTLDGRVGTGWLEWNFVQAPEAP